MGISVLPNLLGDMTPRLTFLLLLVLVGNARTNKEGEWKRFPGTAQHISVGQAGVFIVDGNSQMQEKKGDGNNQMQEKKGDGNNQMQEMKGDGNNQMQERKGTETTRCRKRKGMETTR